MREINISASGAIGLAPAPFLYYRGVSLRETTGSSPALVRVFDGTSATGNVLDEITFAPNESVREVYGPPKIARTGIYVQVVSGAIIGSVLVD
jgi:hypothetical protein